MASISLRNVSKTYLANEQAVSNFSMEAEDGEVVVLLGPDGSGKSTLLRLIAGLERVTTGEIYIDGEFVNGLLANERDVAILYDGQTVYQQMTVYENLAVALKARRCPPSKIEESVEKAAELLDLLHCMQIPVGMLNKQEIKYRIALGRAIVVDAKAIVLDQPYLKADPAWKYELFEDLINIQKKLGITLVYGTSDQEEAAFLKSKTIVMREGRLEQEAFYSELQAFPVNAYVAQMTADPPMVFVQAHIEEKDACLGISFRDQDVFIKLSGHVSNGDSVAEYIGRAVVLGIPSDNGIASGDLPREWMQAAIKENQVRIFDKQTERTIL